MKRRFIFVVASASMVQPPQSNVTKDKPERYTKRPSFLLKNN